MPSSDFSSKVYYNKRPTNDLLFTSFAFRKSLLLYYEDMDEFKNLSWPLQDAATDLEKSYTINMHANESTNVPDVFYSHLLEMAPAHLTNIIQQSRSKDQAQKSASSVSVKKFVDPRTNVEIPTHLCDYKDVDPALKNKFLKNWICVSRLQQHEHAACLKAIPRLLDDQNRLSVDELLNRQLFESTACERIEEKNIFLEKLRTIYFTNNAYRYHLVPPAVDQFIKQIWKKRLIGIQRKLLGCKYRLHTALAIQTQPACIRVELVDQKHFGYVPEITNVDTNFIRQPLHCLIREYDHQRHSDFRRLHESALDQLSKTHEVDFVLPISILRLLLITPNNEWGFRMSVRESALSAALEARKQTVLEKPLPQSYLSGNERYRIASKYMVRSTFRQNTLHVLNRSDNIESKTSVEINVIECSSSGQSQVEYKAFDFDTYMEKFREKTPPKSFSTENKSYSIVEIHGCGEDDESGPVRFKLLIPFKQDAYKRNVDGNIQFVNLSPKIEYQAEYGAEMMTKNELIREWADQYFRFNSVVTERVRFNCESGKIIHRKSIGLAEIEHELENRHGIECQHLLQKLWSALDTLNGFPEGEYLLQNDVKSASRIKVYEKSTTGNTISELFEKVSFDQTAFDEVHWQPIDDTIVTDVHTKHQILPCAFPHEAYLKTNHNRPPINAAENDHTQMSEQKNTKSFFKKQRINPKDDSATLHQRMQPKQANRAKRQLDYNKKRKAEKRLRYRKAKQAKADAMNNEVKGLEMAKQVLADTMEDFITMNGNKITGNDIAKNAAKIVKQANDETTTRKRPTATTSIDQSIVTRSGRVVKMKKH